MLALNSCLTNVISDRLSYVFVPFCLCLCLVQFLTFPGAVLTFPEAVFVSFCLCLCLVQFLTFSGAGRKTNRVDVNTKPGDKKTICGAGPFSILILINPYPNDNPNTNPFNNPNPNPNPHANPSPIDNSNPNPNPYDNADPNPSARTQCHWAPLWHLIDLALCQAATTPVIAGVKNTKKHTKTNKQKLLFILA